MGRWEVKRRLGATRNVYFIAKGSYLRFPDALKTTALVGYLCYENTRSLRLFAGCGHVVWDAGKLCVGSVR